MTIVTEHVQEFIEYVSIWWKRQWRKYSYYKSCSMHHNLLKYLQNVLQISTIIQVRKFESKYKFQLINNF